MTKKDSEFKKISISVNGRRTKYRIGDHLRFAEDDDNVKCVTKISVDSDGCVSYLLTFFKGDSFTSQWMTENDMLIFDSIKNNGCRKVGF